VKEDFANPNYFFQDYQKKGDKLNIPNPNLNDLVHKNSWLQIKSNISKEILVYNASISSQLTIFHYGDYFKKKF
jgi:hypothetical protein